jgi:hypothetical protein
MLDLKYHSVSWRDNMANTITYSQSVLTASASLSNESNLDFPLSFISLTMKNYAFLEILQHPLNSVIKMIILVLFLDKQPIDC